MNELAEYQASALAKISTENLRAARITVSCSPEVQSLFDQAATENWSTEQLTRALNETLPDYMLDHEAVPEVAHYLAQEFALRDKTHTLLVSAETGQVVGQIPPDAIYQPGPVERENLDQQGEQLAGSKFAIPLARIKPEVEAAIIQSQVTRGQEQRVVKVLRERARSTELQTQDGDPRLLVSTRSGRVKLADRLRADLPELLIDGPGVVGEFMRQCDVRPPGDVPDDFHRVRITAHASMPLADMLSINLQHDPYTALKERVRSQWARNLARQVALLAYCQLPQESLTVAEAPEGFLICEPDVTMALQEKGRSSLAVETTPSCVLLTPCLYLGVDTYVCEGIERSGRWEVAAGFDVELHVNLKAVKSLKFTDVPVSGLSVEVV